MANGILTLNPNFPERNLEGKKLPLIEAPVGAGIGLALVNFLKDKNKENLPEKTDEEKTPQEEPPEDPNVLPEIAKELTLEKVRSDVKFKKSKYKDVTDVFYKGKKYAEIEKRDEEPKFKGITDYNLKFPSGYFLENGEEIFQTEDAQLGFKDAKEVLINSIFRDFKNRNKKAKGGMIDKSLPGRSRYI